MDRYPFASDYAAALAPAPDPDLAAREEQLAYQDPFPGAPRSGRPFLPAGLAEAPPPKRLAPESSPVLPKRDAPADVSERMYKYREYKLDPSSPYHEFPETGSDLPRRQAEPRVIRPGDPPRKTIVVEFDPNRIAGDFHKPGSKADLTSRILRHKELFDKGLLTKTEYDVLVRSTLESSVKPPALPSIRTERGMPSGHVVPGRIHSLAGSDVYDAEGNRVDLIPHAGGLVNLTDKITDSVARAAFQALAIPGRLLGQPVPRDAESGAGAPLAHDSRVASAIHDSRVAAAINAKNAEAVSQLAGHMRANGAGVRDKKVTSVNPGIPGEPWVEPLSAVFPHRRGKNR